VKDRDGVGGYQDLAGHAKIKARLAHNMKAEIFLTRRQPDRCKNIAHVAIDARGRQ
jgi:hypothetical protein